MKSSSPASITTGDSTLLTLSFRSSVSAWPAGGCPTVRVTRGDAWTAQEGDRFDHLLHTGQAIVLARHGRVVIQAIHRDGAELQFEDLRTA